MAIIDLDELRKTRETVGFVLLGKEYIIPEMSYALTLQLEDIRKEVSQAAKKEDYAATMNGSIQTIIKVIPTLDENQLREKVSVTQLRKIVGLINQAFIGEGERTEEEKEVTYYREKYEDEYRKKELKTKGKKQERKKETKKKS